MAEVKPVKVSNADDEGWSSAGSDSEETIFIGL